jgi:phenylpropionate dioxygenase-like ring-hydroxylating dioxygenase large terminal subunit
MKARTSFGQHTLGREYFTSPDVFGAERERIFRRSWLLVGHVSQLDRPGRYFLFELDRESVIVLCDGAGELRAFHNHCRHRGSRLCREASGVLGSSITCPYHAWTYGLDGALRAVPVMADVAAFDPADYPLHRVAIDTWQGFVFVNLERDPPSLADALPALLGKFPHRRADALRSVHTEVYEIAANWKLIFHNFSECYHCPTVHPLLNRLTPFRNSENDLEEGPVLGGPMSMTNPDGSMTISGARCAAPFPGTGDDERGRVYYYTVFPSAFVSFHPDYVLVHRAEALAIDRTRISCAWYFHPDAIGAPGFDPKPAIEFWDLTNRQDWELCENAQLGVGSLAWTPGPYSELESQLAAFDRHYLRIMRDDDAKRAVR